VRAQYRATRKKSRAEWSWTNPTNALQGAIHCSFIKFRIYCFSLWYEFFVHCAFGVEKNYQHSLDAEPLEFWFLRPSGCLTNPVRTLSRWFGVISKTPGLVSRNNFVKKISSASAIAIMSWQDLTRTSLCSGVKECGTKRTQLSLSQILFQNPKKSWGCSKILLSFLMRFDGHFWRPYLSSSSSVSKSRIPPKNVWSVQSLIPINLLHQY
jgi:hypothetical protein